MIKIKPLDISLLISILLLISCTHGEIKADIHSVDNSVLIENVPFFAQEEYQCGPASLASAMNFWGINITPAEIARDIYSKSAKGTLNIDMLAYPQSKGLKAAQYYGSIEDLKKQISLGSPLIVLVDFGFYLFQVNHFMTVIGYNDKGFIVNTGKMQKKLIEYEEFSSIWKKTNFWTLLIEKK